MMTGWYQRQSDQQPLKKALKCYQSGLDAFNDLRIDDAMAQCHKALDLVPNLPEALNLKAAVLAFENDYSAAVEQCILATKSDRDFAVAWSSLAIVRMTLNKLDTAEHAAKIAIRLCPDFSYSWTALGKVQSQQDQNASAMRTINRAIELDPSCYDNFIYRGNVFLKSDDLTAAHKDMDTAATLPKNNREQYDCSLFLANFFGTIGDDAKAIECMEQCIRLVPERAGTMVKLGSTLGQMPGAHHKTHQTVIRMMDKALLLNPSLKLAADAHLNRAIARHHLANMAIEPAGTIAFLGHFSHAIVTQKDTEQHATYALDDYLDAFAWYDSQTSEDADDYLEPCIDGILAMSSYLHEYSEVIIWADRLKTRFPSEDNVKFANQMSDWGVSQLRPK